MGLRPDHLAARILLVSLWVNDFFVCPVHALMFAALCFSVQCRPEYKVPGLYVVDSIVRQSRHQFGQDKDVFAPRFTKNIQNTFQHLFKCPVEDRPKIVRVLNLWQKNQVFPPDVIQPLLDMAASPGAVPGDSSQQGSDMLIDVKASKNSLDSWKGWNHGNSMQEPLPGTVQETKTYALTQVRSILQQSSSLSTGLVLCCTRALLFGSFSGSVRAKWPRLLSRPK